MVSLFGLNPGDYTPSALHYPDRTFRETNCYASKRRRNRCPNTATVESGGKRRIVPRPLQFGEALACVAVTAMNADGHVAVGRIA